MHRATEVSKYAVNTSRLGFGTELGTSLALVWHCTIWVWHCHSAKPSAGAKVPETVPNLLQEPKYKKQCQTSSRSQSTRNSYKPCPGAKVQETLPNLAQTPEYKETSRAPCSKSRQRKMNISGSQRKVYSRLLGLRPRALGL